MHEIGTVVINDLIVWASVCHASILNRSPGGATLMWPLGQTKRGCVLGIPTDPNK